jgi:hydrogenase maturation factor
MCLTIPKKVISVSGNGAIVENPSGERRKVKSIVKIKIGDNVLTQNNIIIQKISKKQAQEIAELVKE